jgi:transcriptional regulator GlxA family with amidase domain
MPLQITFLILPHTHIMDLAGPDQVIFEAIGFGATWRISYCSFTNDIMTSAGLPFGPVQDFREVVLQPGDYLMVPGADVQYMMSSGVLQQQTALLEWIRELHRKKVHICGICTGAYVLAMSGILDGKTCTTHWQKTRELQDLFPRITVLENVLFTEQDGIFTSAGIASGIDMTLHIVEQQMGAYFAHKVARELVVYQRRSGGQSQQSVFLAYRNHIHAGIHAVQDWLQEHLDQPKSIRELADIACMSERNFTRVFKKTTGLTVNAYTNKLRLENIKTLLKNPNLTRAQIAYSCGLDSERHLSRIIKNL